MGVPRGAGGRAVLRDFAPASSPGGGWGGEKAVAPQECPERFGVCVGGLEPSRPRKDPGGGTGRSGGTAVPGAARRPPSPRWAPRVAAGSAAGGGRDPQSPPHPEPRGVRRRPRQPARPCPSSAPRAAGLLVGCCSGGKRRGVRSAGEEGGGCWGGEEGEPSPECSLAAMGWSYFAEVGVPGRQLNRSRHISLKTILCEGEFIVIRPFLSIRSFFLLWAGSRI